MKTLLNLGFVNCKTRILDVEAMNLISNLSVCNFDQILSNKFPASSFILIKIKIIIINSICIYFK